MHDDLKTILQALLAAPFVYAFFYFFVAMPG